MSRRDENQRRFVLACSAGFFALAFNFLALSFDTPTLIPIGNIFLFVIAGAFGTREAIWAISIAYIPQVALTEHFGVAFRSSATILLSSYLCHKLGSRREFLTTLTLWCILYFPFAVGARELFGNIPSLQATLILQGAAADIVIALVSGSLLLNESLCLRLTQRPFQASVSATVFHVLALISVVSVSATLLIPDLERYLFSDGESNVRLSSYIIALALVLTVPSWISNQLTSRITSILQDRFSRGLLAGKTQHRFSGLTSSYWRQRSMSLVDTGKRNSSSDSLINIVNKLSNSSISPDAAIFIVDNGRKISFTNRKFRDLLPIDSPDPLGIEVNLLTLPTELKNGILDCLEKKGAKGNFSQEIKVSQVPEKLRYFEVNAFEAEGSSHPAIVDRPGSTFIVIHEITDRRTIEAHLLKVQHMSGLGEITRSLCNSLSESIDHIIDEALTASTVVKDGYSNLREIKSTAVKVREQLRKLSHFSLNETGCFENRLLSDIISGHLPLLKELLRGSQKIVFKSNVNHPTIKCDTNLIVQVLTNLAINARDAISDKDGLIEFSVDYESFGEDVYSIIPGSRPGKYFRLRVRDNGSGMAPEVLGRACDPLFSTKRGRGHVGLGLSTVFAITRAHDGFLTIESTVGKGTTISLYFPIVEELSLPQNSEQSVEETVNSLQPKRVLVVEDEEMIRSLVEMMLTSMGYEVVSESDPIKALSENADKQFDLVLVDMVMPKMDGHTFAQKMKERDSKLKFLIMSGYGEQCLDGKVNILNKPFDLETLKRSVNELIGSSKDI